jgi:hypothetical protein
MKRNQDFVYQNLRRYSAGLVWLTLAAMPALRADVMLRYKTEITPNPHLPQQIVAQMTKGMNASLSPTQVQQLKNGKYLSALGNLSSITDFNKREITLLDSAGKRYATIPADQFGEEMARALPLMSGPPGAAATMKAHAESKVTGRTETISGVEGEEREITITMDAPAMPNVPPGPMLRMVMHLWTAKAGEAARNPAIAELARYDFRSAGGMDPVSMMEKTFEQMPGVADTLSTIMNEMRSAGSPVILRMQVELYMPMVAALMARMATGGDGAGGGLDPNEPITGIKYELAEISTAPIPDSVFQIPGGYQAASASDILKDFVKERTAAVK